MVHNATQELMEPIALVDKLLGLFSLVCFTFGSYSRAHAFYSLWISLIYNTWYIIFLKRFPCVLKTPAPQVLPRT